MKNYYRVVLYEDNKMIHSRFTSWQDADDYIFKHHLHAYIIMEGE